MHLEKENGNVKWFKLDSIRIRLCNDEQAFVAVTFDSYNLCFKLMMFDFLERIKEDIQLEVKITKKWNNQRVFVVNPDNALEFISYLSLFISEWKIKPTEETVSDKDIISDEIWYDL
jgi:hypothetical protein